MKRLILFLLVILLVVFSLNLISAICNETQVNINTASAEDLDKIIGIGPAYAQRIIDARPFSSLDDLIRVSGIGNITLEKIKNQSLACVSEEDNSENEENKESENNTEEHIEENNSEEQNSSEEETDLENKENEEEEKEIPNSDISSKIIQEVNRNSEPETIFLSESNKTNIITINPKTIKTEENSSFQDKGAYLYLLIGFCILLAILYLIQNKGKRKNEFRTYTNKSNADFRSNGKTSRTFN